MSTGNGRLSKQQRQGTLYRSGAALFFCMRLSVAGKGSETTVFDIGKPAKTKPESHKNRRNVGSTPGAKEPLGLRIIGGKFRGRKLQYVGDNRVRPMKDRVREAVFNLIGPVIKGMHVIDLFGGTGALAIEAISRGATSATIIEIHLPTASLLKQNLEMLNLVPVCQLCKTDAFYWVKNETEHPQKDSPWIVFCSPPYDFYVSRQAEMLEMLHRLVDLAPADSMFVIESDQRFDLALLPRIPEPNRIRSYSPAVVGIFTK
jgi:16S rRNA (guanine(966)-N(2))-methyltransferase RsmD